MLVTFTQQIKSCPPLLRDLSQDIHSQLGDIDQVNWRGNFPIPINFIRKNVFCEKDDILMLIVYLNY